jgi:hypothetical protein
MKNQNPMPPGSVVRLKKLWPHARQQGHEKGEIWRIGYYSEQDGLDVIWMVNSEGEYDWTVDHEWLHDKFEIMKVSDEDDFFGINRSPLGPCRNKSEQHPLSEPPSSVRTA